MKLKKAISVGRTPLGLWVTWATLFTLVRLIPCSHSVDLVSSLLSQTPNLSEKLPLPNLKSLIGSSEAVRKLLQNRGLLPFISSEAAASDPAELNRLLAQLKPKQGRFDPAVLDMLATFDNNYSGSIPSIFGNSQESPLTLGSSSPSSAAAPSVISRRMPTSTEENGIIWSATSKPLPTDAKPMLPYTRNRFSSKFRNNKTSSSGSNGNSNISDTTETSGNSDSNQTLTTTESSGFIPSMPFGHIVDPNIRNHRLYDWEFETYKNFTHIDQDEDLMADESEPSAVIVKPTPSSESKYITTTIIPSGWIPKPGTSRPRGPQMESVEENQSWADSDMINDVAPGTYVKLPDSDEPKPPRIREPLRESSTENLIFTHSSAEDKDRDRYSERDRYRYKYSDRDRSEENRSDNRQNDDKFRPSQPEPELSPPVFVDPDQDFFTSTIRNPSDDKTSDEYLINSLPGFRPPRRRHRKKPRRGQGQNPPEESNNDEGRRDRYESSGISINNGNKNTKKYYSDEEEEYYKKMERERLERNRDEIAKDKPNRDRDIEKGGSSQSEETIRDAERERERERERKRERERDRNQDRPLRPIHDELDHLTDDDRNRVRDRPSEYRPANSQETTPYSHHKSDRILSHPDEDMRDRYQNRGQEQLDTNNHNIYLPQQAQSSENRPFYHPSLPYTFGQTSNEQGLNRGQGDVGYNTNSYNDYPGYSQGSSGSQSNSPQHSNYDQIYAGGYNHQYPHPFGGDEEHVEHYPHSDESSWSNTFFILGGLIALSALTAFLLPTLLSSMGRNGKHRNDLQDDDLQNEYVDENTSTSDTNTAAATNNDEGPSDSDLWTEIKGVYNDVVNIVRGDYGGIVDKLTGGGGVSTSNVSNNNKNTKKDTDGPNIVYREEEVDEEDDEKNEEVDVSKVHRHDRQQRLKKNNNKSSSNKGTKFNNRKGDFESTTSRSGGNIRSEESDAEDSDNETTTSNDNDDNSNKVKTKHRTISSSINYIVTNNGRPMEIKRSAPSSIIQRNNTMAGFHLGRSYNNNGSTISTNLASSTEGFIGEWAKVQLIGN